MRGMCEDMLKTLPEAAWDNQSKRTLAAVTRELQNQVGSDSSLAVSD